MIPAASVQYNPGYQLQSATAKSILLSGPKLDNGSWTDPHGAEILLSSLGYGISEWDPRARNETNQEEDQRQADESADSPAGEW